MKPSPEPVHDRESAVAFIEWCVSTIGLGYHPDTPFAEYVNDDGGVCFSTSHAADLDNLQDAAFSYSDPYKEGMKCVADTFNVPSQAGG